MKRPFLKPGDVVLSLVIGLGVFLLGFASAAQDQASRERDFLSDPDVSTCALETTTISSLDLPTNSRPSFVRRMELAKKEDVKKAEITVAGHRFKILLGERPEREFYLFDVARNFGPYWWGSWSLHSHHKIGGEFYEFMLVDNGTIVGGRPYRGKFGTIKVGKGGRDLEKVEFNGSVHQAANVAAPIGTIEKYRTGEVPECRIPVGDYTSYLMTVKYDNLAIKISDNYYTNAKGETRANKKIVYGMKIREDKPYVLDFSNKPMVIFDQPDPTDKTFSRGQEVKFAAVMIDPELDIMIRGLDDTSVLVEKEFSSGNKYKVSKSLDPKVVITRADGGIVAEGIMPFG